MVNYGTNDQGVQDNVVFVSNNGGMLHAIDTDDGEELFAFMPEEFIGKAINFTLGQPALTSDNRRPLYGLDGSWVSWRRPGDTPAAAPDAVYLYGGMRRGGDDYYALDVTDTSSPTVKWKITGGMSTGDFTHLGQTWSTPTLTQVPGADGGDPIPVLIFGGGYDADNHDLMQDQGRDAGGDDVGNAVYIVNALTGSKIWSASGDDVTAMKWSVPGGVAVVDKNFDGVADNVYFGDLGGQVFRIDIDPSGENDNDVHRLADFGGTTAGDNRRFYEPPAVGYVKDGFDDVLYVAIGSGYRSHPLDEATDEAFFVFKDTTAFAGAGSTLVTVSDLTELSEIVDGSVADMEDQGWYYEFSHDGEKAMSSPVIFNNTIRFSTYSPQGQDQEDNPCAVRYGSAFLHTVDMVTGAPAALNDGQLSDSRSQELEQTTPPPTPVLITDGDGSVHVVVGTEVVGADDLGSPNLRKRRWYQMDKDQAGNFKSTQ
jgi:type IV pilus assembly protein PilY1